MSNQNTIQIRVDSQMKERAREIFDQLGIDMSSAIKLFLANVINTKSIPLDLKTENGFTQEQEKKILSEVTSAKKHSKRYTSVNEVMSDLSK